MKDQDSELSEGSKAKLKMLERNDIAARIADQSGRKALDLQKGASLEGKLEQRLDTHQGSMALVGTKDRFALVPWKSSMGSALGRDISLTCNGQSIDWTIGHKRGLSL